ncbi:MAG: hypothetical protein GY705_18360 [Bacteroidetes bacterium]|nr:hypothetical protein [Bacteroidota bacterium]
MNFKKVITLTLTHSMVCIVTFFLTMAFVGKQAADTMFKVDDMLKGGMLVNHYNLNVELQNAYGGPSEYKEALLAYSEALDLAKSETPNNPLFSEKTYNTDKTITYTRIAKLEEKERNKESYNNYKSKALEACNKIPWKEKCNYKNLKEIVTKFEQNSTFDNK